MDAVGDGVFNLAAGSLELVDGLAVDDMHSSLAFPAVALFGLLTAPLACQAAVPSPSSLNSDITLLFNNDLNRKFPSLPRSFFGFLDPTLNAATTAATTSSVLLLSAPHTHGSASTACATLGESLLPVNKTFFENDLVPLLRFQTFEGNFPASQQFWIASKGNVCQTVNAKGAVSSSTTCLQRLPVLCTQSAGPKAAPQSQTSFTVQSEDLTITG